MVYDECSVTNKVNWPNGIRWRRGAQARFAFLEALGGQSDPHCSTAPRIATVLRFYCAGGVERLDVPLPERFPWMMVPRLDARGWERVRERANEDPLLSPTSAYLDVAASRVGRDISVRVKFVQRRNVFRFEISYGDSETLYLSGESASIPWAKMRKYVQA